MPPEVSIEIAVDFVARMFAHVAQMGHKELKNWYGQKQVFDQFAHEYAQGLLSRYNYVRVFGMNEPVPLLSLYVRINILNKIPAWQWQNIKDLEKLVIQTNKVQKTLDVVQTINQHTKCMVLGKPGAGKTTLLKFVALNSIRTKVVSHFKEERMPIFVTLKEFADQNVDVLLSYIAKEFERSGVPHAEQAIEALLKNGKCRLLFDGLDEVNETHLNKTVQTVKEFVDMYPNNQYLITCRTAAYNHQFGQFKDVEIADFDDRQKEEFITHWFRQQPTWASACWKKMQDDTAIKELASVPLLLTLLCIAFEENFDFPRNRALLYAHATDALLRKWDSSRQIVRPEIYKNMNLPLKEGLLSKMAYNTFVENQYFVPQSRFCEIIGDFLKTNGNTETHPPSGDILRGIDAQHSIVTQRAEQIYSFSHLTLQEYFTAKYLVDNDLQNAFVQHILTEDRWREVGLLTTNLLQGKIKKSDAFFRAMLQWLQHYTLQHLFLQDFLQQCNEALLPHPNNKYNIEIRRVFAVHIVLVLTRARAMERVLARDRDSARDRALDLASDILRTQAQIIDLTLALDRDLDLDRDFLKSISQKIKIWDNEQLKALTLYLTAYHRLVICLQTECSISTALREEILNSICAPVPDHLNVAVNKEHKPTEQLIRLFAIYNSNPQDTDVYIALKKHLIPLQHKHNIEIWDSHQLLAGDNRDEVSQTRLAQAAIVLVLVSADLVATEYIWQEHLAPTLSRVAKGQAILVPIIVRACLWRESALGHLQPLPIEGHILQANKVLDDELLMEVVKGLEVTIQNFKERQKIRRIF